MLLNDLASLARGAGLTVHEAPGWVGHNHGAMNSVSCIVIHHTAGAATGDYPSYNVVRNGRSGLPGPLAQLGVGRSGKVYVFSNGVSWHAGTVKESWMNNYNAIGIEVESVGTGPVWPSAQVHATARMTAALCKRYGVPVSRVLGHKEICYPVGRKVDPVGIPGDMPAFRALVQQYINNPQGDDMELSEKFDREAQNKAYGTFGWVVEGIRQLSERAANDSTDVKTVVADLDAKVNELWELWRKGHSEPNDSHSAGEGMLYVVEMLKRSRAQEATIQALVDLVAKGTNNLTVEQVEAAVSKAIEENVVKVDVSVQGQSPSA